MGIVGTALLTGLAGTAASTVLGKIMNKEDKTPAPPTVTPPTPEPITKAMPTADDASVQAARKKSLLNQSQRQGRASTILTSEQDSTDKLGG